jgi:hypothetical protein
MPIRSFEITEQQKEHLEKSKTRIRTQIVEKKSTIPTKLFDQLSGFLDENGPNTVDLRVTEDTAGYWGSAGAHIKIHPRCFAPWREKESGTESPPRLTAVLLHELVHFAFGTELDAEFFENLLFTRDDGAVLPTENDEEEFKDSHYTGVYVAMNPETRQVTDKAKPESVLGVLGRADTKKPS